MQYFINYYIAKYSIEYVLFFDKQILIENLKQNLICKLFKQHIAKSNFLAYPRRDEMLFQLLFDKCKSLNYLWRFRFTIPYIEVGWSDVYQIRNFVRDTAFYELGFLSFW